MRKSRLSQQKQTKLIEHFIAVGSGGATSLDFTLPVIHRVGGAVIVPIALRFGFIKNIFAPIFLVFFAHL